jgi:hypothetical protein
MRVRAHVNVSPRQDSTLLTLVAVALGNFFRLDWVIDDTVFLGSVPCFLHWGTVALSMSSVLGFALTLPRAINLVVLFTNPTIGTLSTIAYIVHLPKLFCVQSADGLPPKYLSGCALWLDHEALRLYLFSVLSVPVSLLTFRRTELACVVNDVDALDAELITLGAVVATNPWRRRLSSPFRLVDRSLTLFRAVHLIATIWTELNLATKTIL